MPALELVLDPADIPRLATIPGMARPGRTIPTTIEWHDTPEAALAADGLALSTTQGRWRLERLRPETAATPPPLLAEATRPSRLRHPLPDHLAPAAKFEGHRRSLMWRDNDAEIRVRVLHGRLASRGRPHLCRLLLQGPPAPLATLAATLATTLSAQCPRASLADQALAAARGDPPTPRALGAPHLEPGQPVTETLAAIIGHLADVMLHWAALIPAAPNPEPVHQMRVATRRLRSALSVYHRAAPSPALAALSQPLKDCATRLGHARDWDVFLENTGASLAEAFPDDRRCAAMLRASTRRRRAAYAALRAYLAGPGFRALAVTLATAAALRPWAADTPQEPLQQDTAAFAKTALARRLKRVRKSGHGIAELPTPALHELRKDCKRLRYAAEFFAPLFPPKPGRRFLTRLADLQEELGLLNDGAAITGLMAQLGRADQGYAAGLVEGFAAAHAAPARARIVRAWKRLRAARPFWAD